MTVEYIAVKDFDRFQHYKGRTPPWIKFYNALLDDYRFLQLPDAARSQLMLIWLVASRHGNRIPNDTKYITEAIHCTSKLQLDKLLESGWLYLTSDSTPLAERYQDASTTQAKRPQNATLEVEEEREVETEIETTHPLVSVPGPWAEKLLAKVPERRAWVAEINAMLEGMGGHIQATPAQIENAARDMLANGVTRHPNIRQFRRYVEGAAPKNGSTRTNGKGTTTRAMKLIGLIRDRRNPLHSHTVVANWQDGLSDSDIQVCKTFGLTRILNDQNEGTMVAQLTKALEESSHG